MSELHDQLAQEADRQRPAAAPDLDILVRRSRRRQRGRQLSVALAAGAAVLAVPVAVGGGRTAPDVVAPVPVVSDPPLQKTAPPPQPFAFTTLLDGVPLPRNEWQVAVDPAVSLRVEARETAPGSAGSVCELVVRVETLGPGEPVSGDLARVSGWSSGARALDVTWDGRTAAGGRAPQGTYRLVARHVEANACGPAGTVRGGGQSSLGQLVLPAPGTRAVTVRLPTGGDGTRLTDYLPVVRALEGRTDSERASSLVRQLAVGPTDEERARGLSDSGLPEPALIRSVTLSDGRLVVDLDRRVGIPPGDTAGAGLIGILLANAFELAAVTSFEIRSDGSCAAFAAAVGADACVVRTRAQAEEWRRTTASEDPPG